MISIITGTLEEKNADSVVVMTPGGIGFNVSAPTGVIASLGQVGAKVRLYTYMHVREDNFQLLGFESTAQRDMFLRLIAVSGVGPKAALSILSAVTLRELGLAIASGDAKVITRAPGVGKKMADRIILELKGKLTLEEGFEEIAAAAAPQELSTPMADAAKGLMALGYTYPEALDAVKKAAKPEDDVQSIIFSALRLLGK